MNGIPWFNSGEVWDADDHIANFIEIRAFGRVFRKETNDPWEVERSYHRAAFKQWLDGLERGFVFTRNPIATYMGFRFLPNLRASWADPELARAIRIYSYETKITPANAIWLIDDLERRP